MSHFGDICSDDPNFNRVGLSVFPAPPSGVQDSKIKNFDSRFKNQDSKIKNFDSRISIQDLRVKIQEPS